MQRMPFATCLPLSTFAAVRRSSIRPLVQEPMTTWSMAMDLVSVNVNRLVEEGYLHREPVPDDRRKTRLLCTKQAQPIIDKGRALQAQFAARLLSGMSERQRQAFADAAAVINHNLDEILQEVH